MATSSIFGALNGLAQTAGTSASNGGLGQAQDYLDAIQNNFGTAGQSSPQVSSLTNPIKNIANSFALFSSPSRFAAFLIGIILIGGGILVFVFQPNVNTLRSAARKAIVA